MQETFYDYSELSVGNGCCLNCYDAHPGCLCYECKCKKCYWYSSPEKYDGEKGHCDKTDLLREERKKEIKEKIFLDAKESFIKFTKLLEKNKEIELKLRQEGKIPSVYTCQKCKREFVSDKEFKIEIGNFPECDICKGLISLNKEEEKEAINWVEKVLKEDGGE